jgi:Thioesterase-like superfamily
VTDYYYRRLAPGHDAFDSSEITASNWDAAIQHGSPPLALLTKAIEEQLVDTPLRIGRLTLDILGAIPVAPVKVRARITRPRRRIFLLESEMTPAGDDDARAVARVTAWAIAAIRHQRRRVRPLSPARRGNYPTVAGQVVGPGRVPRQRGLAPPG